MNERDDDPIEAESTTDAAGTGSTWSAPPTAQTRATVERAVGRLLDALAPERAAARLGAAAGPIERHRTPRGCILQAPAGAVSVSWFSDAADDDGFGELQVVAWRGVVSRPGSAHRVEGATVEREMVLRPVGGGRAAAESWSWRAADGTIYDTDALAALCLALLAERVAEGGEAASTG